MAARKPDLFNKDIENLLHPWTHQGAHLANGPLVLEKADGVYIYDSEGNRYLEGMAGLWCTSLGYGNEELAQAAYDQIKKLSYAQLFASKSYDVGIELAERLNTMVPFERSKVFFGNSGSDANDTQIKLVWYYNNALGRPKKKKIISRLKAYHGITLATASLTGLPPSHIGFDLPLEGGRFIHAETPHFWRNGLEGETEEEFSGRMADDLEKLILSEDPDTIAAFIAEPLMGAGGVILPSEGYFKKIQPILKKYDILFIDDEVVCGFGRTGRPFGMQTFGLEPDTISLAKAITSAYLPLSAVVMRDHLYEVVQQASGGMGIFGHGYTWGGHPVACAVALKTLEIYKRDNIFERAANLSPIFQSRFSEFSDHPLVGEVRGVGLIGAAELVSDKAKKSGFSTPGLVGNKVLSICQKNGLICRAIGDVIAFCPPLIITEQQIDELFEKFKKSMDETLDWYRKENIS